MASGTTSLNLKYSVSYFGKLPKLASPFQTAVFQDFARKGAAGLGIGRGTTHFSRKDGG